LEASLSFRLCYWSCLFSLPTGFGLGPWGTNVLIGLGRG